MSVIFCPQCSQVIRSEAMAGQTVACPGCGATVPIPGTLVSGQLLQPPSRSSRPQPILVINQTNAPPRLQSAGWFTRAFSTTSGVLVSLALFAIVLIGLPVLVLCGGGLSVLKEGSNIQRQLTAECKEQALPVLGKFGILTISDEAIATHTADGALLTGTGMKGSGRLVNFAIAFTIAKFGTQEQWQVKYITLDGNVVYPVN